MDESALVTVVVPIYNVEQYLDRCLTSIVGQTYRNIEIVLVDDGSLDNCPKMCDEWAKKDSRIRVIHKKNEGLGMARNTGIDNANGDYICFVDSDDHIALHTVEKAINEALHQNADLVMYGFILEDTKGAQREIIPTPSKYCFYGDDVINLFLPEFLGADPTSGKNSGIPGSTCACLIAMDTIDKIGWRFMSEREYISEDVFAIFTLCRALNKVIILPECCYYYCSNEASLTHTYRPDRFQKAKYFYEKCICICQELAYPRIVQERFAEVFVSMAIASMKHEVKRNAFGISAIRMIADDKTLQDILALKSKEKMGIMRRVLFWTMRKKLYVLSWLLLLLRNCTAK